MSVKISVVAGAGDDLWKWWIKSFRQRPKLTLILTLIVFAGIAGLLYIANRRDEQFAEARRRQVLDYETQMTELSKVETSLRNLTEFVRSQRTRLKESEDLIASLKSEERRLTPVVEADRRVINAVLDLQAKQLHASMVRDRWVGFGLGIVASLVASVVYGSLRRVWLKRAKRSS